MKRKITVWNWHGDTTATGEPIPRVLYNGPAKDYRPANHGQPSKRSK